MSRGKSVKKAVLHRPRYSNTEPWLATSGQLQWLYGITSEIYTTLAVLA